MWLLEGGGVIVRRRKRVQLESRGSVPLSDFSHGGMGVWLTSAGRKQRADDELTENALEESE